MEYLEKDIFKTVELENLDKFISSAISALKKLPPLAHLINVLESVSNLSKLIIKIPFLFLQSVHSINRAFNSDKYSDLLQQGNSILSQIGFGKREKSVYNNVVKAYNNSLDLDYIQSIFDQHGMISVLNLGQSPQAIHQRWQQEATKILFDTFEDLKSQLQRLLNIRKTRSLTLEENKQKKSLQWKSWKLVKVLTYVSEQLGLSFSPEQTQTNFTQNLNSSTDYINNQNPSKLVQQLRTKIDNSHRLRRNLRRQINIKQLSLQTKKVKQLVVGTGSVSTIINLVSQISNFFLSSLFLAPVSNNLLPALSYTVTSVVLKYMGSAGAMATHYFAGHILRGSLDSLPVIFRVTGMGGMAWGYLAAFAPWITLTAILIIIGIQTDSKLGENLYLFASTGGTFPDLSYLILSNANNQEIYETIKAQAEIMENTSGKNYSSFYGFSVYKNRPMYGLDLKQNRILSKGEVQAYFYSSYSLIHSFSNSLPQATS